MSSVGQRHLPVDLQVRVHHSELSHPAGSTVDRNVESDHSSTRDVHNNVVLTVPALAVEQH